MFSLNGLTHAYGAVAAVDDVTLRVDTGQTVALIGPSGCGKSSVLKLAIGLIWPSRGEVRFDDLVLGPANALAVRRRVGYVIQSGGLFPHLSALDNVTLAARHLGRHPRESGDPGEITVRVRELAELVQLPVDLLRRRPGELSGGQRQRVSLMRALMLDPDVLLLDEPLGALDPMVRHGLQVELKALFARLAKSVLLVTHDLAEAAFFSSHIVLMQAGRIVQQGSYRELATSPANEFVREFLQAQRGLRDAL
jgi:osmoprotectant transport system ATP-binding protein